MPLEHRYICPLPNGVHARPASVLEETSRRFASDVTLLNQRTGRTANAKSILSIVGADIRHNDLCLFTVSGPDETSAMNALTLFLQTAFPTCDEPLPMDGEPDEKLRLPPLLRSSGAVIRRGVSVSSGIARGRLVRAGGFAIPPGLPTDGASEPDLEHRKLDEALDYLIATYTQRIASSGQGVENALMTAHRSIARDAELRRVLLASVHERGRTAAGAISDAEAHFTAVLTGSGNALLRERSLDIQDICLQLLHRIYGKSVQFANVTLTADSIVVAETLTPGQFLGLDRRFLKGLVLQQAGGTSHTVILARSFGIPALTGLVELPPPSEECEAIVDADLGALVTKLTDTANRYYQFELRRLSQRQELLASYGDRPASTLDGQRIEIAANIGIAAEAGPAFAAGAEAVGLFRTEMLFLDRDNAPSEDEQYQAYRKVLEVAAGRSVIIRTVDIGGDKPAPWLKIAAEANPALGWRAVRLYPSFDVLFRTQVRALLRASSHGPLKIMAPMITTVDEARWVKGIIAGEQARCAAAGIAFDRSMPVGAMIEVPSAAFSMDDLCRELDFFSIGSNDLLQYFVATDRCNTRVASLYDPVLPAFLRLLKQVVDSARSHGKWIGLCGEMGGQVRLLPLLAGLRLNEISAVVPTLASLKAELARLNSEDCRVLLESACVCVTAADVSKLLVQFDARRRLPLIERSLIVTDIEADSKEEAIKQAVDLIYVHDRSEVPRDVEEAVWEREAAYSTGFGYGFAIPHCKSAAVKVNTLALLKLRKPVAWGSLDNNPVGIVILLAMRADAGASEHMKVFAKLARQVMHEDFRAGLQNENDPERIHAFLTERLAV